MTRNTVIEIKFFGAGRSADSSRAVVGLGQVRTVHLVRRLHRFAEREQLARVRRHHRRAAGQRHALRLARAALLADRRVLHKVIWNALPDLSRLYHEIAGILVEVFIVIVIRPFYLLVFKLLHKRRRESNLLLLPRQVILSRFFVFEIWRALVQALLGTALNR